MRRTHSLALGAIALLTLTGLTACGGDDEPSASEDTGSKDTGSETTDPTGGPSAGAATKTITIKDFAFSPKGATAKVGDTITVVNDDDAEHTLTAEDDSFDTGSFGKGEKTIKLTKAGTIEFFCDIHDYMKGSIKVEA